MLCDDENSKHEVYINESNYYKPSQKEHIFHTKGYTKVGIHGLYNDFMTIWQMAGSNIETKIAISFTT